MTGAGAESAAIRAIQANRVLAFAYAGRDLRTQLEAVFDLDDLLASQAARAREPQLAMIRLAWWRDALGGLDGTGGSPDPALERIRGLVPPLAHPKALASLAESWMAQIDGDDETFAAQWASGIVESLGLPVETKAACGGIALAQKALVTSNSATCQVAQKTLKAAPLRMLFDACRPLGILGALLRHDLQRVAAGRNLSGPIRRMSEAARFRLWQRD